MTTKATLRKDQLSPDQSLEDAAAFEPTVVVPDTSAGCAESIQKLSIFGKCRRKTVESGLVDPSPRTIRHAERVLTERRSRDAQEMRDFRRDARVVRDSRLAREARQEREVRQAEEDIEIRAAREARAARAAMERAAREQVASEQAAWEQAMREAREQAAREQAARKQSAREQAAKEVSQSERTQVRDERESFSEEDDLGIPAETEMQSPTATDSLKRLPSDVLFITGCSFVVAVLLAIAAVRVPDAATPVAMLAAAFLAFGWRMYRESALALRAIEVSRNEQELALKSTELKRLKAELAQLKQHEQNSWKHADALNLFKIMRDAQQGVAS